MLVLVQMCARVLSGDGVCARSDEPGPWKDPEVAAEVLRREARRAAAGAGAQEGQQA